MTPASAAPRHFVALAVAGGLGLAGCRGSGGSGGGGAPPPSLEGGASAALDAAPSASSASTPAVLGVPPAPSIPPGPPRVYRAHPVTDGHALEVRLTYAGKPLSPWPIPAAYAPHCGGATQVPDPALDVDDKGGVSGAVVWLDDLTEGEPLAPADVTLDQRACAFAPHVVAMAAGASLRLTNGDPANHAARLLVSGGGEDDAVIKMLAPGGADAIPIPAAWNGRMARITCPIHPWMMADAFFFDHPYFAVTRNGLARLEKVPRGTWHLSVWQHPLDARFDQALGAVVEGPPAAVRVAVTVADRDVTRKLTLGAEGTIR